MLTNGNVLHSFRELINPELLEGGNAYFCSICQCKQTAERRLRLDQLPPTMNLHLLRFVFEKETFRKLKVKNRILQLCLLLILLCSLLRKFELGRRLICLPS
jgi:ubiquitin C-terminal hydrolase